MTRIAEQDYNFVATPSAENRLVDVGFDLKYGTRPLKRALRHRIENRLTGLILDGETNAGGTVCLRISEGKLLMKMDERLPREESKAGSDEAASSFALPSFTSTNQEGGKR